MHAWLRKLCWKVHMTQHLRQVRCDGHLPHCELTIVRVANFSRQGEKTNSFFRLLLQHGTFRAEVIQRRNSETGISIWVEHWVELFSHGWNLNFHPAENVPSFCLGWNFGWKFSVLDENHNFHPSRWNFEIPFLDRSTLIAPSCCNCHASATQSRRSTKKAKPSTTL